MTKQFIKIAPKAPTNTFQPIVYSNFTYETNSNNQQHITPSNHYTNEQRQTHKNFGCIINPQDCFRHDYLHPEQLPYKISLNNKIETTAVAKNTLSSRPFNSDSTFHFSATAQPSNEARIGTQMRTSNDSLLLPNGKQHDMDINPNVTQILKAKRKILCKEPSNQFHKYKQTKFKNNNLSEEISSQSANHKIELKQQKKYSTKVYLDEDSLSEIADQAFNQSKKFKHTQPTETTSLHNQHPFNTFSHYSSFAPSYLTSLQFTNTQAYPNNNHNLPTTETRFDFHFNSIDSDNDFQNNNLRKDFPKLSFLHEYAYNSNIKQSNFDPHKGKEIENYYLKYQPDQN
ncbi:8007_t:CDS:1 [Ambispora leptoticha]|uniref:8007_t:CDS:1 n=1 Tax=Ambispora leptoticha TaxID=144679 RepID=A0A9N8ZWU7_9GLOM|nr:8007_t:CDS:1 [Ambispora leptoticha]